MKKEIEIAHYILVRRITKHNRVDPEQRTM